MRLLDKRPKLAPLSGQPPLSPTSSPTQPKPLLSPWVKAFFGGSVLFCLVSLFVAQWDSVGPTIFPIYQVNPLQYRELPAFLQLPAQASLLALPTAIVVGFSLLLRSIPATNGSRLIFRSILLVLALRYFTWRTLMTFNFTHWTSTIFSILLYIVEVHCFFQLLLHTFQTIWSTSEQRTQEADRHSQEVISGRYLPTVDVFVPTYNEPEYIVRRTVIGCQSMEYPNKRVYILDDTRRPHIRALAEELGCEYITRPDNTHAKAGNLNHALRHTSGELIAVFDADFVPFHHFLTRTIGFFQNPKTSLIQTQQNFYNPDYHARNLGVERFLPHDLENFFGYLQSCRDAGNSVICCGTSYVVRRSEIEAVGGYYTRCCVEDFQTSVLMLTRGARIVYLNEKLSMGESTRTYADFIDQRLRWLQGNLQIYYCGNEVPIWSKLNWIQKSYALTQFLFCFYPIVRVALLLTPLLNAISGITPYIATFEEIIYYFVPFMILNVAIAGWACNYRTSWFWDEVYDLRFCFPALGRLWLVLRHPFAKASRVTRKGIKAEAKNYNLNLTWPLILLILLSVGMIALQIGGYWLGWWLTPPVYSTVMLFWLSYNVVFMVPAVLSSIDQPVRRLFDRFPLHTDCHLQFGHSQGGEVRLSGITHDLSEQGVSLNLPLEADASHDFDDQLIPGQKVMLHFGEYGLTVQGEFLHSQQIRKKRRLSFQFCDLTLEQTRRLVTLLYSDLRWWKVGKRPGGLDGLLALVASMFRAKSILAKYD